MAKVTFTHLNRGVTEVRVELQDMSDSAKFMLTSDEHLDNKHCQRDLFRKHLERAVTETQGIIQNGDLMCLMQGKYDRRSDRSQLMSEFQGNNYLDSVADYTIGFLEPYAHKFILIGRGNHETSILKHHETDMTDRVVGALNHSGEHKILSGGYGGWVLFRMRCGKHQKTIRLLRHHGWGGAARMSKGVLDSSRMAAEFPDAHIVMLGHKHTEYIMPVPRNRITDMGKHSCDEQLHLRIPGYKAGANDLYEGWEVEKGFPPTTIGCMALELGIETFKGQRRYTYEPERWK